tara:strand:+ start:905 stop:1315 length:411 start_codon:yes stop_codon:yes gene_type:complete
MALTREELIEMAVDRYFIGANKNDADEMCSVLSEDSVMRFTSAKYLYKGHKSILIHLNEFTSTFKIINFHNFVNVVDVQSQSIAVRFQVYLEAYDSEKIMMNNCNFFQANGEGLFNDCLIYNSAPLEKGFQAGSAV